MEQVFIMIIIIEVIAIRMFATFATITTIVTLEVGNAIVVIHGTFQNFFILFQARTDTRITLTWECTMSHVENYQKGANASAPLTKKNETTCIPGKPLKCDEFPGIYVVSFFPLFIDKKQA